MRTSAKPRVYSISSIPAAALAAFALIGLSACASLQRKCSQSPWLLCGDRVVVRKDYVYLDDPAFLYDNKTVAVRAGDVYGFRLSLFFNPYRFKSSQVTAEIRPRRVPVPPRGKDSDAASTPPASPCRIEGGSAAEGSKGIESAYARLDTAYAAAASERKDRVTLMFLCKDYRPEWGREDTLALRFSGAKAEGDSVSVLTLPFATSFHGPVYSFAIGAALIVSMTAVGEILAAEK
jgi:hypothetical protein